MSKKCKIWIGVGVFAMVAAVLAQASGILAQSSGVGATLSNPHPYGAAFVAGAFDMQITHVDLDAWPEIVAENQFNDPPPEGQRYVMWTIAVENVRGLADDSENADYLDFEAVVSGVRYEAFGSGGNWCGIFPNSLDHDLFLGGRIEANICLSIPKNDSNVTLLYEARHTDSSSNAIEVEVWFEGLIGEWRGLTITPENRCSDYDRNDYDYPASVEDDIVDAMDGLIYGPYTGTHYPSTASTTIEHIVALSEAHDSGLCSADGATRDMFASDLANLTLASREHQQQQGRS